MDAGGLSPAPVIARTVFSRDAFHWTGERQLKLIEYFHSGRFKSAGEIARAWPGAEKPPRASLVRQLKRQGMGYPPTIKGSGTKRKRETGGPNATRKAALKPARRTDLVAADPAVPAYLMAVVPWNRSVFDPLPDSPFRCDTVDLDSSRCPWPHGEPRSTFHYCGMPKAREALYCDEHEAIAFNTPKELDDGRTRKTERIEKQDEGSKALGLAERA